MKYNTGNYEKYMTKNPLKRHMVENLNASIVKSIGMYGMEMNTEQIHILDAGCGEGIIDRLLAEHLPKARITGLEYTPEAIQIARDMNPGVAYIQGDIKEMPFENNSFDIVMCTEVLEHIDNPGKALAELIRVSKRFLYITVPHEPWFCMGNLLVLKNITRFGNPEDHIHHWTKKSFLRFLQKEGMRGWKISGSFPWIIGEAELGPEKRSIQ